MISLRRADSLLFSEDSGKLKRLLQRRLTNSTENIQNSILLTLRYTMSATSIIIGALLTSLEAKTTSYSLISIYFHI
jgi:hypothetical protein